MPSCSARSRFSIFIASTTASSSPAWTSWPASPRPGEQARHRREQELGHVGRRLDRHQRQQLGGARRQHLRLDLRAPSGSGDTPVPSRSTCDDSGGSRRPCRQQQARRARHGPRISKRLARRRPRRSRRPTASTVQGWLRPLRSARPSRAPPCRGKPACWPLMRARPAARPAGWIAAATASRTGSLVSVSSDGPWKPSGNSSAMKSVCEPARDGSADGPAAPPGTACCATTPRITNSSSASRMRSMALVRGRAVGDQLGDHRVVEHRDLAALVDAGVDAHGRRRRPRAAAIAHQPAGRRQEVAERVLGVDAALDRPAVAASRPPARTAASRRRRRGSSARPGRAR